MNKSGIVLIVVGALLLAHNLGWLAWDWLRLWWPVLLIALGLWSLLTHRPGDNQRKDRNGGSPLSAPHAQSDKDKSS